MHKPGMTRERWMAVCFATGSTCFLIGPSRATRASSGTPPTRSRSSSARSCSPVGGALQSALAFPERRAPGGGPARLVGGSRPIRGHAVLQRDDLSGAAHGPVEFRVRPARVAAGRVRLDMLPRVGRDRLPRLAPARLAALARGPGMVGAFGQPARLRLLRYLGGRRLPRPLERLDRRLAAANWNTCLGAACFLACAVATLFTGRTLKSPRLRRLHELETVVEREVKEIDARI